MDPERWQRVGELFHGALEQGAEERARFLDDALPRGSGVAGRGRVASRAPRDQLARGRADPRPGKRSRAGRRPSAIRSPAGGSVRTGSPGSSAGAAWGVVHLAEDTRLGRLVAIKALPAPFTRDERRRRRLRREARAAASLAHPGIATVYALEEFDDTLCIVSEYVPGATLRQELAGGTLPAAALPRHRDRGCPRSRGRPRRERPCNRDLKPDNVIRTADAGIKLVDFGLARFDDPQAGAPASTTQLTAPGAMLGTPGYMAPEQIRGGAVDVRTDIFAFGVLLFELATGRHPFSASNPVSMVARGARSGPRRTSCRPRRPVRRPCGASSTGACRRSPARRYAATRALVDDLERARGGPAESTARPAAGGGTPRRGQPGPRGAVQPGVVVAVPSTHGRAGLLRDAVPPVAGPGVGARAVGIGGVLPGPRRGARRREPPVPSLVHGAVHARPARPPAGAGRALDPRRGLRVRRPAAGRDRPAGRGPPPPGPA